MCRYDAAAARGCAASCSSAMTAQLHVAGWIAARLCCPGVAACACLQECLLCIRSTLHSLRRQPARPMLLCPPPPLRPLLNAYQPCLCSLPALAATFGCTHGVTPSQTITPCRMPSCVMPAPSGTRPRASPCLEGPSLERQRAISGLLSRRQLAAFLLHRASSGR